MTDKEKLEKLKKLADEMYYAASYITTDASRLKKAMYDYHQFIIQKLHKEEPVSEDLKEATEECIESLVPEQELNSATPFSLEYVIELLNKTFKAGAQWQKEKTINMACEWLEKVFFDSNHTGEVVSYEYDNCNDMIDDFRKTLDEGRL